MLLKLKLFNSISFARIHNSLILSSLDVYNPAPIYKRRSIKETLKAVKDIPHHCNLLKDEIKSQFANQLEPFQELHGKTDVIFDFKHENSLDNWMTKSDIDFDCGQSRCTLEHTKNNTGLFFGYTMTTLPNDGITKYTGFCTMKSKPKLKSFNRIVNYYIGNSTHIAIRFRGDGRSYLFMAYTPGIYDITTYDQYQYPLHTRGGPYWQTLVIPWTRMVLTTKGRIQDKQDLVNEFDVQAFGITIHDGRNGPFKLEIDYIAMFTDLYHNETFAYELYRVPTGANFG